MRTHVVPSKYRLYSNPLMDRFARWVMLRREPWFLRLRTALTKEKMLGCGTVSIIVPFHNTERYLEAALDSIRFQRYWDLQVILVDDASTDNSSHIARRFVAADPRFQLIRTTGLGPGGARNAGLAHARGKYLAFVDGDDILPSGAIARLADSLRVSSSPLVVGAFEHLRGEDRWRSPWVQREHKHSLTSQSLDCVPGITRNVFPWNKLFERSFFMKEVGAFPEGTLYEDQVPTAKAFIAAPSFDILNDTVYLWRQRESGDSITQNRSSDDHLDQRMNVLSEVDAIYSAAFPNSVHRDWLQKSLNEDLMPFIEASDQASEAFRERLSQAALMLWSRLSPAEQEVAMLHENAPILNAVLQRDYERARALCFTRTISA